MFQLLKTQYVVNMKRSLGSMLVTSSLYVGTEFDRVTNVFLSEGITAEVLKAPLHVNRNQIMESVTLLSHVAIFTLLSPLLAPSC